MQEVAHHLQVKALEIKGPERDAFARSAYNRYYYACYLEIRIAFGKMSPSWARAKHKEVPTILQSVIAKTFRKKRSIALKLGDRISIEQIDRALRAISTVAPIIERANATRIVADYSPETAVGFNGTNRFSLNGVEITEAHEWNQKVRILMTEILSAWKQTSV